MNLNRSLVFGLLVFLGAAPAAHAATIEIDFDLSASTVSIPAIPVPLNGGFQAASARVRVLGDGISTPLSGRATLSSFVWSYTFTAPVTYQGFTIAMLTGYALLQLEEAVGNLNANLSKLVFTQPVRGSFSAYVGCTPALVCGNFGDFPFSTAGSTSRPPGTKVFVRPNRYEAGRANITVYNWNLADTVAALHQDALGEMLETMMRAPI